MFWEGRPGCAARASKTVVRCSDCCLNNLIYITLSISLQTIKKGSFQCPMFPIKLWQKIKMTIYHSNIYANKAYYSDNVRVPSRPALGGMPKNSFLIIFRGSTLYSRI